MKQFSSGCKRSARASTARVTSSGEISLRPIRCRSSTAERKQRSSLIFKLLPKDYPADGRAGKVGKVFGLPAGITIAAVAMGSRIGAKSLTKKGLERVKGIEPSYSAWKSENF